MMTIYLQLEPRLWPNDAYISSARLVAKAASGGSYVGLGGYARWPASFCWSATTGTIACRFLTSRCARACPGWGGAAEDK